MFVSKKFSGKMICFKTFCTVAMLFSAVTMAFTMPDISAKDQLKSEEEILRQKIAKKSEQDLVAQKLRQEMEAYREKYGPNHPKSNEIDKASSNSKNSEKKILDKLSKHPAKASREENEVSKIRLIKSDSTRNQAAKTLLEAH